MAQTMMHLLKDVFKNFNKHFMNEILNQRELIRCKTVENDFIRIYSLKSGESIAFGFNNLEDLNGLVTVSFTDKSNLTYSNTFEFEIFRELFKKFIKNHSSLSSNFISYFSLTINERSDKKKEFKELFFEENDIFVNIYLENKKIKDTKLIALQETRKEHSKLVSDYSKKIYEELGLGKKEEEFSNAMNNFNSSKELFYGSTYNRSTLISQFYEKNSNLKTSLGFNIFNSHVLNELESL